MRTFSKIVASSVFFGSTTQAISSSGQLGPIQTSSAGQNFSIGLFGNPGVYGGPTKIEFSNGFTLQANFGGNGNSSSGTYGGLLNLLVSNVPEKPMFVVAASALVSSTGSVMFNSDYSNYLWVDYQFLASAAGTASSGFVTVTLTGKTGGP